MNFKIRDPMHSDRAQRDPVKARKRRFHKPAGASRTQNFLTVGIASTTQYD